MNTYFVWDLDNGQDREDAKSVRASSHEEAARTWAHWSDSYSAEYHIVSGNAATVMVALGDGEPLKFIVHGESTPTYRARAA